jgi:N-acetylneuraminate lyase
MFVAQPSWSRTMPAALSGLIPACHTPFDRGGNLELSVVSRQAELFRESGMTAVFIAGTTGEWSSLTSRERMALCDRWTEAAGSDLKVAVHVGHNAQAEAVALAAHARESGAAAVAAVAPSYFKPASVSDLVDFLIPIAAAADPLPFYYYEIPGMTGVRLSTSQLLHEARFRIPNLRGLKFSFSDLVELQECVNGDGGALDVLFGQDEFLLAGLALGVRGAVGSTYNFAGRHYQRLMRSFTAGELDAARARQFQAARLVQVLGKYGFMAASKAVMGLIGVDCGPVRPPLRNLTHEELTAMAAELGRLEMFDRPIRHPE